MVTRKPKQLALLKVKRKGFYFDAATHSYYLDGRPMTGVTTILGVIAKPALIGWAAKMVTEYIKENCDVVAGETEGTISRYLVSPEELELARKAHAQKRDKAAEQGTDLHALVEEYVKACIGGRSGKPTLLEDAYWDPIKQFAEWAVAEKITFLTAERQMYSKDLFVAGTVDLVFEKDGRIYVGDVKTYAKIWDRVPFFQAAGYGLMFSETEGKRIDGYCIIRISKDGSFETLWSFDVEGDTEAFLACVTLYRALQAFNSIKVK